jgi:post-segregation antitoxin (ccd killing protein)
MANVTIYLPDDLAARAKRHNLNISRMTRDTLTRRLAAIERAKGGKPPADLRRPPAG